MATTEAPTKKKSTPSKSQVTEEETPKVESTEGEDAATEGNDDTPPAPTEADEAREEHEAQLEILEPLSEPKRWVIGKPPEKGGTDDEYSIYVQRPLEYMARLRFFSLVSKTVAESIKAGGVVNVGGNDLFGGSGSVRQRVQQIQASDFNDASSFMQLAMQLIGYAPEFLLECYCLWLGVPSGEKTWAKLMMNTPYNPDGNQWGLTQKQHMEIVEVFIDQNYEDIRDFFVVELPRLGKRVQQLEKKKQEGRESESVPSKQ